MRNIYIYAHIYEHIYMFNKGILSRIYKELHQLSKRKGENLFSYSSE